MGCSSCGTGGGTPRGCKNNGTCSSGGCNKLGVFDWLANMQLPNGKSQFDIVEIRFKNSRKSFFRNLKGLDLNVGDVVAVEASPGYDVGVVSVVGELSRIQLQKKAPNFKAHEARKIIRHALQEDIDKWVASRKNEESVMHKSREMAIQLKLDMKISDVEFQGDGSKATFYYTANGRVDFRQLIKDMADNFRVRIEMRQIGARQESARLGGIGSCGRELCCSTWLTDFRTVSTSAARYQQLSLNPQKLAGQCGKLKCCLNYELDMYIDELKDFPSTEIKLYTKKGSGIHIKTDVFKRLMWYLHQTDDKSGPGLVALSPERVKEIIALNKEKNNPDDLKDFDESTVDSKTPDYADILGQDDLSRFDKKFTKGKKRKNPKRKPAAKAGGETKESTPRAAKAPRPPKAKDNSKSNDLKAAGNKPKPKGKRPARKNPNAKGKPTDVKADTKPVAPGNSKDKKPKEVDKKPRPAKKRPPRKQVDDKKPTNKGKDNNEKSD
ncbi:MAG TPA: regulatory iron-sulfur-containing complex subunit RicT [Brumimicrobium sp.]|nr:regulatory iron-sulfur-containing complex subunit RicT [Brumimicrobium sp.]